MQLKCSQVKAAKLTPVRNQQGDVITVYDLALQADTEDLLPKVRQIFSNHVHVEYKNAWVTSILPTQENIDVLVQGGRSKWNIENQTFNTLKNQGYRFEHNYGHGYQNLSVNMCFLMFSAFIQHAVKPLPLGGRYKALS
jgi:hypothetical protein